MDDILAGENERFRDLWGNRIEALRESGKTSFTYDEISKIWEIGKPSLIIKVSGWAKEFPELVCVVDNGENYQANFRFYENMTWPPLGMVVDYSEEKPTEATKEDKPKVVIPEFLTRGTYDAIMGKTPKALREYEFGFSGTRWDTANQRGTLCVKAKDDFEHVVMQAWFQIDNGYIVNRPKWNTG